MGDLPSILTEAAEMMMRGSKEQHDAIFSTNKRVEEVQESTSTIHKGSNGGEVSQDSSREENGDRVCKEEASSPRQPSPNLDAFQRARLLSKTHYRFDQRIGGWRRVY